MNPHFLFNSLNSIKHYIIHNEQKSAVLYLNKFSKLIRRILEASSIKVNSLKEELETVKLYMNIENIRFDNQIDFQVDIDPDINQQTVRIPSLILQPFLENAIWHGLATKEGEKKIRLEVKQTENAFIIITIRDNGIGREASDKLQKDKMLKRKSMGIPITRERLASFSRVFRNTFNLSFEDLYRDDGSVEGTQVILKIPTV
jgi:sensor histidine kinase YesM